MSIIDRAKALAAAGRRQRKKADQAEIQSRKKKLRERETEFVLILKAVRKLEKEDPKMFRVVESERLVFGEIAEIFKLPEEERIGSVCLQDETYMWRGSDESPEQQCSRTHLTLRNILNEGPCIIDIPFSEKIREVAVKEAIAKFEQELSRYLSRYF